MAKTSNKIGEDIDDIFDTMVAAEILKIKPATLAVWRATRRVRQPAYIKVGHAVRYSRSAIQAYLAAQTVPGSTDGE